MTATYKAVARLLTMCQFSEADMGARIGTLSGGEKARVATRQVVFGGDGAVG